MPKFDLDWLVIDISRLMKEKAYIGCLLGTAVGDSLGLPYEGIHPQRAARLFPNKDRHYFFFGRGMVSDDTEHACFTAQAIINAHGDADNFQRHLARSLRWWLLGLPAGVGLATLKSVLRLWIGIRPNRSGVFSAGNGPAMRSPILGLAYGDSKASLREFVSRCTEITHSDPKAYYGALAIAVAAYLSALQPSISANDYLNELSAHLPDDNAGEFLSLVHKAAQSAEKDESVTDFAVSIGSLKGISGYMYHTVPCVIQVWLKHADDFAAGLQEIISAGGDTDTTGAILGAILGARSGKEGIPAAWLDGIIEWPRSIQWIERLGVTLAKTLDGDQELSCPGYFAPGIIPRNVFFLIVVLFHGLRRLAPPY
ncbi:ADP-ribosylglycohydrolase family protein [Thermodesulfobacteriota bacterium]